METSLNGTQTGISGRRGRAGRPSRLGQDAGLANRIIELLDAGCSMRQVAKQLKVGLRTIREWSGAGEEVDSGPMRDIALAVQRSKRKRGFTKGSILDASVSSVEENYPGMRAATVTGTAEDWSRVGYDLDHGGPIGLKKILNHGFKLGLEARKILRRDEQPANAEPTEREPHAGLDLPSAGHYQVLKAGTSGQHGWGHYDLATPEFEALYACCQRTRAADPQFIPVERCFPRDYRELASPQQIIVDSRVRVLVRDSSANVYVVDFARVWA